MLNSSKSTTDVGSPGVERSTMTFLEALAKSGGPLLRHCRQPTRARFWWTHRRARKFRLPMSLSARVALVASRSGCKSYGRQG
jgi:protein tyrosine phosphatase (PTP) superfamily phosphohydrolase (DUF442 family)